MKIEETLEFGQALAIALGEQSRQCPWSANCKSGLNHFGDCVGPVAELERNLRDVKTAEAELHEQLYQERKRAESTEARVKELEHHCTRYSEERDHYRAESFERLAKVSELTATLAQRDEALARVREALVEMGNDYERESHTESGRTDFDSWTRQQVLKRLACDVRQLLVHKLPAPAPERSGVAPCESWAEATSRKAGPNPEPALEPAPKAEPSYTYDVHARLQDIADEAFGPFPTEPPEKLMTLIEQGISEQRQRVNELKKLEDAEVVAVDLDARTVKLRLDTEDDCKPFLERFNAEPVQRKPTKDALPDAVKQVVGDMVNRGDDFRRPGEGDLGADIKRWASTLSAALEAK